MKKINTVISLLLFVPFVFADIPMNRNTHHLKFYTTTNLLPWVLLILMAVGVLLFLKTLKDEKNAHH